MTNICWCTNEGGKLQPWPNNQPTLELVVCSICGAMIGPFLARQRRQVIWLWVTVLCAACMPSEPCEKKWLGRMFPYTTGIWHWISQVSKSQKSWKWTSCSCYILICSMIVVAIVVVVNLLVTYHASLSMISCLKFSVLVLSLGSVCYLNNPLQQPINSWL